MLSDKLQAALNEQIKNEFYSAYLYLAMSAYFESKSLPGFAKWMRKQAEEEMEHAMKIYDFIHDCGGTVQLQAIDQPPTEFGTPQQAFEQALEHEKFITGRINELYKLAQQENDYPTQVMLQWFIEEQVEEEKTASEIVEQLKLTANHGPAILMMDHRLGKRE